MPTKASLPLGRQCFRRIAQPVARGALRRTPVGYLPLDRLMTLLLPSATHGSTTRWTASLLALIKPVDWTGNSAGVKLEYGYVVAALPGLATPSACAAGSAGSWTTTCRHQARLRGVHRRVERGRHEPRHLVRQHPAAYDYGARSFALGVLGEGWQLSRARIKAVPYAVVPQEGACTWLTSIQNSGG